MATRTWTNNGGLALSAQNLNALEADLAAKADKTVATAAADGLMPKADKAKLDAATPSNTDGTIVMRYNGGETNMKGIYLSAPPVSNSHATRKDYVDTAIAGIKLNAITSPLPSAAPSTYPLGYSYGSGTDAGWPEQYGTVMTTRLGTARVSQTYSTKGGNSFVRTEIDGDAWSAFKRITTDSGAAPVAKGELVKNVRDYKLAGAADDNAAITAAHGANNVVYYPDGDYNPGIGGNMYNSTLVKNALGPRWQSGQSSAPMNDVRPVMWVQKHINSEYAGGWDQGAGYFAVIKEAGTAYASGLTGYAATYGGSGDTAGIHGRARVAVDGGNGFGIWAYAYNTAASPGRVVGLEVDVRNDAAAQPVWAATSLTGAISGLVVALSDGISGAHQGIRFPQRASNNMQRFWTGLQFDTNTIMPIDANGNGEAIRIRGSDYTTGRYGGIAIGDATGSHMLSYGLRALHADISDNKAIWLARDHRIVFGPDVGSGTGTWIELTETPRQFNIRNVNFAINGTQVVGSRKIGWSAATGTATRTAFDTATVTLPQLAERLKALIDDLRTHGLIGT